MLHAMVFISLDILLQYKAAHTRRSVEILELGNNRRLHLSTKPASVRSFMAEHKTYNIN